MSHSAALPFRIKRSTDVLSSTSVTSIRETVHGILRLDAGRLTIQWRVGRRTQHVGEEIRTDQEVEPVRETVVPLRGIAGAAVRRRWWRWLSGPRLILNAADLKAFDGLAGDQGLALDHPAELVLGLRRRDRLAAEEFCAELEMALAELELPPPGEQWALREGSPGDGRSSTPPARGEGPARKGEIRETDAQK